MRLNLYIFSALMSLLLSYLIVTQQAVINPDAICYLVSAENIGLLGFTNAIHLCDQARWPFYPLSIHWVATLSHLSYPLAAYTLNALFSCLTVLMFIAIVKTLGGKGRTLWLAAATILLAHECNAVREYIIRDHGFWAFYLTSFFFLLHFFKRPTFSLASFYSISLIIATLYRIEGLIFLLLLPFISLLHWRLPLKQRLQELLMLFLPLGLLGLFGTAYFIFSPYASVAKLSRINEVATQFHQGMALIIERYQSSKIALMQHFLNNDSKNEAGLVFCLLMFLWYGLSVIKNISLFYSVIIVYGWWKKTVTFTQEASLVIGGYLGINVLITVVFLLERFFLSKRYLIALSLILMLWVPFTLNALFTHIQNRKRIAILITLGFLLTAFSGVIDIGYSKNYLKQAGEWIAFNVPTNANLYVNDYQLMYYSKHYGNGLFAQWDQFQHGQLLDPKALSHYDYLAIRLNKKDSKAITALMSNLSLLLVSEFSNKRGDKVAIYKVKEYLNAHHSNRSGLRRARDGGLLC